MGMHVHSKQTVWRYEGARGRKISKKQCAKFERRREQKIIRKGQGYQ